MVRAVRQVEVANDSYLRERPETSRSQCYPASETTDDLRTLLLVVFFASMNEPLVLEWVAVEPHHPHDLVE